MHIQSCSIGLFVCSCVRAKLMFECLHSYPVHKSLMWPKWGGENEHQPVRVLTVHAYSSDTHDWSDAFRCLHIGSN